MKNVTTPPAPPPQVKIGQELPLRAISGSGSKFVKDQRLPKSYEDDLAEMDVEVVESVEDPDSLKIPPPPTPPSRKRRHSQSKAKATNQ